MKTKHIKRSFSSDFSRNAREGHINLESLAEPIPILPEGVKFCQYLGDKYPCCKKKVCFDNDYCGVKRFRDKYKL